MFGKIIPFLFIKKDLPLCVRVSMIVQLDLNNRCKLNGKDR